MTYSWSVDKENYRGQLPTLFEALMEARLEYDLKSGKIITVGQVRELTPTQFVFASDVLEQMAESASDEVGEAADDWPPRPSAEVFNEYAARLETLLNEFAAKHCPIDFWAVDNMLDFRVTESGFEGPVFSEEVAAEADDHLNNGWRAGDVPREVSFDSDDTSKRDGKVSHEVWQAMRVFQVGK